MSGVVGLLDDNMNQHILISHLKTSRRQLLNLVGAAVLGVPLTSQAHGEMGPVAPRLLAPAIPLTLHDGRQTNLRQVLSGRWTALQLMFTGCSALCPIQGAVFSSLQNEVFQTARLPQAQLLSISIDPLADHPAALAAWLKRFEAQGAWLAAAPPVAWVDQLLDFVKGRSLKGQNADRHTAQVYVFDTQARLAFRLAELADPAEIAKLMRAVAGST
jgi:protein SCO1